MKSSDSIQQRPRFQLSFRSRCQSGGCLEFPCDEFGWVDMDSLGEKRLINYLYARAVVGAEFVAPVVERTHGAPC